MSTFTFHKATKEQAKLRLALHGGVGAGKTFSALSIATAMGKRIAVIDTEHGSASKYSDRFDFDVLEVTDDYHPNKLIEILGAASEAGYEVVIIDSLTHFWNGPGGFLSLVDEEAKKSPKHDTFGAWKKIDPIYKRLIQTILSSPIHVIATARAKQSYELTKDERGKNKVEKMGMAPELRDSWQYEFDIEGMLDMEHNLVIGKTRCAALDGKVFSKPGAEFAKTVLAWLSDGVPPVDVAAPFFAAIAAAATTADLDKVAGELKALGTKLNGQREKLLAAWVAKKKALATAPAPSAPAVPDEEATP